jgi:hypothetical protein
MQIKKKLQIQKFLNSKKFKICLLIKNFFNSKKFKRCLLIVLTVDRHVAAKQLRRKTRVVIVLTLVCYIVRVYKTLLNLKLILDCYPQINPHRPPVHWLTRLTEKPQRLMLRFIPTAFRPLADVRGTIVLTILHELLKFLNRLTDSINDGLFDEYFIY